MTGGASMTKDEFPPLLGEGLHPMSIRDLKTLVVDGFPQSQRRAPLWSNLVALIDKLTLRGIECDLWVDGSYLTKKLEPDDVDFVLDIRIDRLHLKRSRRLRSHLGLLLLESYTTGRRLIEIMVWVQK